MYSRGRTRYLPRAPEYPARGDDGGHLSQIARPARKVPGIHSETTDQAVKHMIVIAHEESGPNLHLRRVIQEAGATAIPFAGAFNFSAMNNLGADLADTPNLLFLNDDLKATSPGWADMMVEQLAREEVGIAGAVLWYPSRILQHAGVVVGIGGIVGHAGRHASSTALWPWLLVTRNVSAVTGACSRSGRTCFSNSVASMSRFPITTTISISVFASGHTA